MELTHILRNFLNADVNGTVKYYAQIRLQVWQNEVCIGAELPAPMQTSFCQSCKRICA